MSDSYHVEEIDGKFSIYNHRREFICGGFTSLPAAESYARNQPLCDQAVRVSRDDTFRLLGHHYDPTD